MQDVSELTVAVVFLFCLSFLRRPQTKWKMPGMTGNKIIVSDLAAKNKMGTFDVFVGGITQ